MNPGPRRESVTPDGGLVGDQQRRRTVGDLAGDRRREPPALGQRLERADLLPVRLARSLVEVETFEGAISASKRPFGAGADGALVGAHGELLHLSARDVPLLGHRLGADELADLAAAVAGRPTRRTAVRIVETQRLPCVGGRHDRHHAHVLHAAGDDEVHRPRHHGLGGELHRLLGRAALTIDRHAGDMLRQPSREPARAGDASRLRPDRVDVAEHDVVDRVRVDAGAFDERRDAVRSQVSGMDGGETAAATTDG